MTFLQFAVLLSLLVPLCLKVYSVLYGPLSSYPGPVLAKFTNLWRLIDVWKGGHHNTLCELHRKHGSIVRIGPNQLSLSDPEWIQSVYRVKSPLEKSLMYTVNDVQLEDGSVSHSIFSVRDEKLHAEMDKPIAHLYGLKHVLSYEKQIDVVLEKLMKVLNGFAKQQQSCDVGRQLLYSLWCYVCPRMCTG